MWGQCDVIFTSALLGVFYYVLVKRPFAAAVAFGLAGSLKPQAVFLVPVLAGLFFRERWSWRMLFLPPLVYGVRGLPGLLAGKPVLDLILHWGAAAEPAATDAGGDQLVSVGFQ